MSVSVVAAVVFAARGEAQVCRSIPQPITEAGSRFNFVVEKADKLPDDGVTRVAGALLGEPHTSNRIDKILLINGNDTIVANDIDGVDFERYYQWEDDGLIRIEIDFPVSAKTGKLPVVDRRTKMVFNTVRGDITIKKPL